MNKPSITTDSDSTLAIEIAPSEFQEKSTIISCEALPEVEIRRIDSESRDPSLSAPSRTSLVSWNDEFDPANPKNFKSGIKILIGIVIALMNFIVSFAISVFSGIEERAKYDFGVSLKAMNAAVSLYILGLAFGPLFFGPASEYYGRRLPLIAGMIGFMAFTTLVTTTNDFSGVLIFRFLAGVCGSAAYVIPPGIYVDLYNPVGRAVGYMIFASGAFIGGSLGPGVGAAMLDRNIDWKWSMWATVLFTIPLTLAMMALPETLEAIILQRVSKRLRLATQDWALHCPRDEAPFQLRDFLLKPWRMLPREPVLIVITIAFTLDYGIQSLTYTAIPKAFSEPRHWTKQKPAWALTPTIAGFALGCIIVVLDTKLRFAKRLRLGGFIVPESRLPPMIAGMTTLSCGLLLFAWSSRESVPPWVELFAEVPIGAGMYMVWVTATVYLQDLYVVHANSALAACAFVRYAVGSAFPMFAEPMATKLGVQWATYLLGILCGVLVPFHVAFYLFGRRIRAWSKFALNECYHVAR